MRTGWLLLMTFLIAAPAQADQSYAITVIDEHAEGLAAYTKTANLLRRRAPKGAPPVELTLQQALQQIVDTQLEHLAGQLQAAEASKPWAEKSSRAKQRHCAELRLPLADCPK